MIDEKAIWYPSNNYQSRNGHRPKWIICHGTAGGGAENWFRDPSNRDSSANYVVKVNGDIYAIVDEDNAAWANGPITQGAAPWWVGDPNNDVVSIEFEKLDTTNDASLTQAQISSGFGLIDRITKRWSIPRRMADATGGITGHFSIDPVYRSHCPGPFPFPELISYLNKNNGGLKLLEIGTGMGRYFVDKGNGVWFCPSKNVDLIGINLQFYRQYEGVWGLPLTNEIRLSAMPGTAIVICERAIQCFDPEHKFDNTGTGDCYLMHLDKGIAQQIVAKPLLAACNAQIADLEKQIAALKITADVSALEKQLTSTKQALHVVYTTAQQWEGK